MRLRRRPDRPSGELVELAALADGSLAAERRQALEAEVARSDEAARLLAEQERAVALVRAAGADVEAPARLRARIEAERRARSRVPRPRALVLAGGAVAAAVTAVALALTLPGGVPGGPTTADAAALAALPATGPAPDARPGAPALLGDGVDGVPFPSWSAEFGWNAVGSRTDELQEREARTIFYAKEGKRIAYTIVAGDALKGPEPAALGVRGGVELRFFEHDAREAVTWLRDGRTCVLSGVGVSRDVLGKLAVWKGDGAVPF
jgi:hypothetical protein